MGLWIAILAFLLTVALLTLAASLAALPVPGEPVWDVWQEWPVV